ncbi:oxidoreductase, 2OG-Fe(II) oxygenase family protein [Cooperia oncophora]
MSAMSYGLKSCQKGKLHPEMWEIFENRKLWEARYVHPGYHRLLNPETEIEQACTDVYDYPLVSERFCKEMIEEMEHFGHWSDGSNKDDRLAGGYENVPTRDIHMRQIDYARHWLYFLDEYVRPIQEKVFTGYFHQPVEATMMFVVRYRPDEQPSLRPHHDASTFSIDIALNKKGVDYEGGGVKYPRYNCIVPADQVGWAMMFPGRLTHLHEGLPTTKGTRYILVSFVNP